MGLFGKKKSFPPSSDEPENVEKFLTELGRQYGIAGMQPGPALTKIIAKLQSGKCLLLKLDLSRSGLTDAELAVWCATMRTCPFVMELDVRGNSGVSDTGMLRLSETARYQLLHSQRAFDCSCDSILQCNPGREKAQCQCGLVYEHVSYDTQYYLTKVRCDGSVDSRLLDSILIRLELENLLAWLGKCYDFALSPAAAFPDVLDKTNARDALKACGLPSGVKDVEKMAENIGVYDGSVLVFEREQFTLYVASLLRSDLYELIAKHAEWPDFVMDMPFDPVCAVPVMKPTPTHVSGGGAAGPAPSESAKSIPPIAAAPPPNHDDQDLEEDDFEEEELDEESEYETDEDTEPPAAVVAAVTTAPVTAMKPLITPEANAYPSEDEGTEASEGEIQGSQPQQTSQKPPVVILPSLLAPALTPAPAPVASTISDDSEYTSDDEPPTVTVSTSAVKTQETSDSESEVSFGDEVEDVLPQSATVNQSSFAHPSPQLSVTAPTTLPVMPPSPPVSVSRSMTSLSQFERKDDGFDTLPVDDTVVQASNVYDDSLAEAVSLRRGSEASSRASIRFGKPESPISRQPSRQRAASTPQSAIVESKPSPSITLDLSDKTIEAIEIAVLAHDPLTGNVTQLILSGCKSLSLSSLHQLSASLSHVTDLVLSRCNLGTISSQLRDPKWLDFVPALTTLDLSDNDLTSIPNLESHRKLVAINLSKNRLKVIGGLEALTQLSELDVSYNEVKSLLSLRTLSLNSHLRSLIVTPNPLTQLDRRHRAALIQLLPQLSHLDGEVVPVTKSGGASQSLNVSTISSVGSVTSFISKFSKDDSKLRQSRSKSPQVGFRASVSRPAPVKPQPEQQKPAATKRASLVPRCATVPLKRTLLPQKVAESARIVGQRRSAAIITAVKLSEMAKPKNVRPKFGTSEWTEQAGVAPIKKQGFGTSASRNMTFVKPVVEAVDDALVSSKVLTVHGVSRSKSPAVTRRSSRFADTPPRYMQPTANVTANQTVTPPTSARRVMPQQTPKVTASQGGLTTRPSSHAPHKMIASPPPPPPSSSRPHQTSVVPLPLATLSESELHDWLLDAEELLSTCLTGMDVMLRLTAKHGIVPAATLAECKKRLVAADVLTPLEVPDAIIKMANRNSNADVTRAYTELVWAKQASAKLYDVMSHASELDPILHALDDVFASAVGQLLLQVNPKADVRNNVRQKSANSVSKSLAVTSHGQQVFYLPGSDVPHILVPVSTVSASDAVTPLPPVAAFTAAKSAPSNAVKSPSPPTVTPAKELLFEDSRQEVRATPPGSVSAPKEASPVEFHSTAVSAPAQQSKAETPQQQPRPDSVDSSVGSASPIGGFKFDLGIDSPTSTPSPAQMKPHVRSSSALSHEIKLVERQPSPKPIVASSAPTNAGMSGSLLSSLFADSSPAQKPTVVPTQSKQSSLTADLGIDDDDFDVSVGSGDDDEEVFESPRFDSRKLSSPKPAPVSAATKPTTDSESEYETDDDDVAAVSKPVAAVNPGRPINTAAPDASGDEYTVEEIEEYDEDEEGEEGTSVRFGDWEECFDKRYNRVYYYNVKTQESSWTLPKQ